MNQLNFYRGRLGHEDWICSCDDFDIADLPNKGDMVHLPVTGEIEDGQMYVIMQRYVAKDEINYFCKAYDWED